MSTVDGASARATTAPRSGGPDIGQVVLVVQQGERLARFAVEDGDEAALGLATLEVRAKPWRHLDDVDGVAPQAARLDVYVTQFAAFGGEHHDQPVVRQARAGLGEGLRHGLHQIVETDAAAQVSASTMRVLSWHAFDGAVSDKRDITADTDGFDTFRSCPPDALAAHSRGR